MNATLTQQLGYVFRQPQLLQTALTHKSAATGENYQRMEFLGDAVLGAAIALALYERYPYADEGQLTQWRANLVNREFLAALAIVLALPDQIIIHPEYIKLRSNTSVLSDIVEALLAAVFLDGGWDCANQVIRKIFNPHLDQVEKLGLNKDPKTQLQEYLQARKWPLPQYHLVMQTGPQHRPNFVVQAKLPSFHSPQESEIYSSFGEGVSRKDAERQAAIKIIAYLESVDMDLESL